LLITFVFLGGQFLSAFIYIFLILYDCKYTYYNLIITNTHPTGLYERVRADKANPPIQILPSFFR